MISILLLLRILLQIHLRQRHSLRVSWKGKNGFGGDCLPKDVKAILEFSNKLGLDLNTIKGAWDTNLEVRPERDWENLKGRAVVDETD